MQDISEKINHLLRVNSLNQNELAEKVGVSKQVINSLCNGKVKTSKALYPIAKFFGVEYNWLIKNLDDPHTLGKQINDDILILDKFHKIPFLLTQLLNKDLLINGKLALDLVTDNYELTSDPEYKNLFVLSSTNNSLKFRFKDNCTLIFHTNLKPISGDFIIAYLPDKELFVYRDLKIEGKKRVLIPVDEDIYKSITLKETDIIVAVLYERRIKRLI